MSTPFARRLAEQRKRKKVSQKEAAGALGVSQALLSHYENGIREPGLDFVVRSADYYGVSCDYLLGHTNDVLQLSPNQLAEDFSGEEEASMTTFLRVQLLLWDRVSPEHRGNADEDLLDFYGTANYFALWEGVKKGEIPPSWLGENPVREDQLQFMLLRLGHQLLESTKTETAPAPEEAVPSSVSVTAQWFYDRLNLELASRL